MIDPKVGHPKLVCSSLLAYQLPIVKAPPCKLLFPVEHSFKVVRIHIKAAFPKFQSCVYVYICTYIWRKIPLQCCAGFCLYNNMNQL